MSCAPTPAEMARPGIQTAFFTRLDPLESIPEEYIPPFGAWHSSTGALFWCSIGPVMLPGQCHMG